jgi:Flp pilus assembly protein TadD
MSGVRRLVCVAFALLALFVSTTLAGCAPASQQATTTPVWEDPDGDPYNFYRAVGYTLLRTRQYMKATQSIKRMVKLHPDRPEPHYMMARAYLGMEQYDTARKLFQRAIGRDEKYAPAHAQLGVLFNMLGRHPEADAAHKKAIELDDDNAAYRNNLGFSQYMQGRLRQAVTTYLGALEHDAAQKRIHNNLAFAYAKLGSIDKAYAHFRLAGPPAQATNNLAYVAEEQGQLERAYDLYLEAVKQDPELVQAHRNLERVCRTLGRSLPDLGVESTPTGEAPVSAATAPTELPADAAGASPAVPAPAAPAVQSAPQQPSPQSRPQSSTEPKPR